jgi:aspartyl/glutamyl-tRNA(Asn/Gln) amidotransferase C subunit
MPDQIQPELFEHLVQLAALELDPQEADYLRSQLNKQLKSIEELLAIPLDPGIPPAAHGVPYPPETSSRPRMDELMPDPHPEWILEQAPETEDGYIVVPEIPHTEL